MIKRLSVFVALGLLLLFAVSIASADEKPDVIKLRKDLEISRDMTVKDVIVIDGNLTVLGRVEGNIVVVGGVMTLKSGSYVGGSAVVVGEISKDPAAQVLGKITQVYMPHFIPSVIDFFKGGWMAFWATISLLALLGFLGLSVLVIALVPEHMSAIVLSIERSFLGMFLWGVLWTMLIVPIAVLLAISIVGIVLIPLEVLLVALALLIGYIASAIFIGNKIFLTINKPAISFLSAILGMVVLFLIGFVPIAGAIVKSVFLIAGFGAVVTSKLGTVRDIT
ncbi:MAG: hypothetical protein NTY76_03010 [Candidatus Omnitrophica bacterium]|nr:hypothetical protein [Candidatus Omnitrophota bacterium]